MYQSTLRPDTIEELQEAVRRAVRLLPCGGGSKPGLSTPPAGVLSLDCSALSGVIEYEPQEFTFTAHAGTPLAEVLPLLRSHGQYLPFDPLLSEHGATLGAR